ncbi:hypothetical protein GWK48_08155 [Metallosphaera tengchongensis]|uniref:Uncharacterized protein n=1 Tax=Metallosphaera tengchongensis TaxID=1532350 RepID=A0A6N0NZ44_9CREN|nr:hypothetical protein [Metallosphaera tengchongensis]QKR00350.1 hypothetical protein GWK48_08155 [Metallosphaera tengchongensis]
MSELDFLLKRKKKDEQKSGESVEKRTEGRVQSGESVEKRTEGRVQSGESVEKRTEGRVQSGESVEKRTEGRVQSGESVEKRTEGRVQSGESVEKRTEGRVQSGESVEKRTEGRVQSGESVEKRTEGRVQSGESVERPNIHEVELNVVTIGNVKPDLPPRDDAQENTETPSSGIDEVEKLMGNFLDKDPKIGVWSYPSYMVLQYLFHTKPGFKMSKMAKDALEIGMRQLFPDLYSKAEKIAKDKGLLR